MTHRIRSLSVPLAFATVVGFTALPALAVGSDVSSLNDGQVHGFTGCLAQEPAGVRYFDLTKAKADDGTDLGTVRLTSSVWGINPKQSLNQEIHVDGMYRGHYGDDPGSGHIAVKDAAVVSPKCS
jgi:hypothetical protein